MNKYVGDLSDYFENLCTLHPDLLHVDASGQRVYEVVAYEDAFSDFRTAGQEKEMFVRFIMPTMRFEKHGNNARKKYQAGLMVGCYYSRREDARTEMMNAWSIAERVADDFVARMVNDSRAGAADNIFYNTIDLVENMNLSGDFWETQGDGSFVAVLYMFDVGVFRCMDPGGSGYAAWTDL